MSGNVNPNMNYKLNEYMNHNYDNHVEVKSNRVKLHD